MATFRSPDNHARILPWRGRLAAWLRLRRSFRKSTRPDNLSLRTSLAILKAQQEATIDGILVVDSSGRVLSYNRRFLEIWGIPQEVVMRGSDTELLQHAFSLVSDIDGFIEGVTHLYLHPDEIRTDDLIPLLDGRILSRASVPVVAEDGSIAGRAWYFRDITQEARSQRLSQALFRISEVSRTSQNLDELYASIHQIVGELMDATNFYIALYDEASDQVSFPYFVDQLDEQPEAGPPRRGLTGYVLRTGRALSTTPSLFSEMVARGEIESIGAPSVDWLGVPLKSGDKTYGVLGVQSYSEKVRYGEKEKEILTFVSQNVAAAIEHKRKEDDLRDSEQRYRAMFETNRAVKLIIDPDSGSIIDANLAACEFYGYSPEEIRAKKVWDINILPASQIQVEMARAVTQRGTFFNFRHRLASGEIRDVEVHTGPIETRGRKLLYSIIHDVTERRIAEAALKESEEKHRSIFDFAPVGIYQSTLEGDMVTANATLARILGYDSPQELLALNLERDIYVDPQERRRLVEGYREGGGPGDQEVQWRRKDGSTRWLRLNAHVIHRESLVFFEGFVHDITERKKAEETLRTQSAAIEASMDGIAIFNARGRFTYVNDAFLKLYGYSNENELLGRKWTELAESREAERIVQEIVPQFTSSGRWRGEITGRKRSGMSFPQEISVNVIQGEGLVCVVRDITERTYAEEQIKHLAYHDALTGLPNRLLFKDRLGVALSHALRDNTRVGVIFFDLDRFKVINDSLGHNVGDYLLQAIASRIQSCLRDSDTVARLGGDEFIVLLPNLNHSDDAVVIAEKIIESIRLPFTISGRELFVTTSIGISLYPEDGGDAETLIKNSDTAMYQAKEQGRDNYQLFNAVINARALERLVLESGLRRALTSDELVIYYQAIFDLRTGRIHGTEALLRWIHPDLGMIHPGQFISVAESTGLMVPIGLKVLRQACEQSERWRKLGFRNLTLAVNLAMGQLQQPEFIKEVTKILRAVGMEPRLLELEITETSAMQNPERSIACLEGLKKLGVRISLDDFGIGHSSLSYLKRFPIDTLKIDQSFVRDMTSDADTAAIVSAIIAMAHKLRLVVTAEGVETEAQRIFLNDHRCDRMQGFLFSRPVKPEEFAEFLVEHNRATNQW